MPAVTERATKRLAEVRKRRGFPDSYAARLSRREGKLVLDFTDKPADDDHVAAEGEVRVLLDSAVADDLKETYLDVQERDGAEALVLRRSPAPS